MLVTSRAGHPWERIDLARDLEKLLGRRVDLATLAGLPWRIRSRDFEETVAL